MIYLLPDGTIIPLITRIAMSNIDNFAKSIKYYIRCLEDGQDRIKFNEGRKTAGIIIYYPRLNSKFLFIKTEMIKLTKKDQLEIIVNLNGTSKVKISLDMRQEACYDVKRFIDLLNMEIKSVIGDTEHKSPISEAGNVMRMNVKKEFGTNDPKIIVTYKSNSTQKRVPFDRDTIKHITESDNDIYITFYFEPNKLWKFDSKDVSGIGLDIYKLDIFEDNGKELKPGDLQE
jgi:hypothetical protein